MAWQPDYVTLSELKAFASISTTSDDAALGVAITAASRAVDAHANRQFGQVGVAEERAYTAHFDYARRVWVTPIDDLTTVDDLVVEVGGVGVDTYGLEAPNAVVTGRAWTRLILNAHDATGCDSEVGVTALWGWAAVPPAVKQATLIQALRFFTRRKSPYGIAGSPDTGGELRLLSRVDPDVGVALRGYVRPRSVA